MFDIDHVVVGNGRIEYWLLPVLKKKAKKKKNQHKNTKSKIEVNNRDVPYEELKCIYTFKQIKITTVVNLAQIILSNNNFYTERPFVTAPSI